MLNRILALLLTMGLGCLPMTAQSDADAISFPFSRPLDQVSVEEYGNSARSGLRFAYPMTNDLFIEAAYGKQRWGRAPIPMGQFVDGLSRVKRYDVSLGYNVTNGERLGRDGKLVSRALYLIAGVGTLEHGGQEAGTLSYGMGYRFAAADSVIFHLSVRDRLLDPGTTFTVQKSQDLELSGAVTVRF